MTNTNNTPAPGAPAPWGRIAGVAVLAGGVIALTVVAINGNPTPSRIADQDTTQVSTQPQPDAEQADEAQPAEAGLTQADLSGGEITPELTRRLMDENPDPEDFAAAIEELRRINAQRDGQTPTTTTDTSAQAERQRLKQEAINQNTRAGKPVPQTNTPTNPNAMVTFEPLVYDFGDIYSTTEIPGRFTFTSTGTEPLVIERVNPTCGCTSANKDELRNSTWEPGEGASIEFSYSPAQKPGTQTKTINVTTNSESNRNITLTLKANYIPAVKTSLQNANFGRIEAGSIGQARVIVESRDPDFIFEDFDLGAAADNFNWEYTALESTDEAYPSRGQLLIQTKPDARTGPISRIVGTMKVLCREGDAEQQKPQTLNIALRGEIVGQIEFEPGFARAPLATPGSAFEHRITVNSRKGEPFEITDVKLVDGDATDFSYEVLPVEGSDGTSYQLVLSGNAPQRAGGYMGRVDILTDIPNHGPASFQFSGVLRAASPGR